MLTSKSFDTEKLYHKQTKMKSTIQNAIYLVRYRIYVLAPVQQTFVVDSLARQNYK